MTTTIRPADIADTRWLVDELRAFDEFAGFELSLIPNSDSKLYSVIISLILNHVFFVAEFN
jgi:hypothetical protein